MRYELSDREWNAIRVMLPNKPRGVARVDDRRVLNGIFWVLRSGAPWRDLPDIYGPRTTCYNRFVRWQRAGIWTAIMNALAAAHDAAIQMIDTSMVRVHQHAACITDSASQSVGRSRGGLTTKLHVVVDANGLPVRLGITPGEAHDNRLCSALLTGLKPHSMVLADRGYDADWIRAFVNEQGAWANIPPKRNRKGPICFSAHLYRARNLVERFFNKIKHCRRVATRYDKLAANYLAFVQRDEARRYLGAASLGQDRGKAKSDHRSAPTVADLTRRYIEEHARTKKRPRSVEEDERLIRLHILPRLRNTKVAAITRQDVLRLNHDMRDRPGAANRTRALLSKMFNLAERWGLRPDGSNPCRHVEKYPENKLERFLNREELARLGAVLAKADYDGTEMPSAVAAIRLLLLTGCRRSEILRLKWSEVDFEQQCLRLGESKTGAKTVYLCKPALKLLRSLQRDPTNPYVMAGDKPSSHLVNLRKPWHRLRSKAGLNNVRIHDLRHSFASAAASRGGSLPMIGRLLGHSQAQTTERYAHLAADPIRALNEATGKHIADAMDIKRHAK